MSNRAWSATRSVSSSSSPALRRGRAGCAGRRASCPCGSGTPRSSPPRTRGQSVLVGHLPGEKLTAPAPVRASLPRSERSTRPQPSVSVAYSASRAMCRCCQIEDSHARLHPRDCHTRRHLDGRLAPPLGYIPEIVDSLPDDWTDLELDLRLADESRYIEASVYLVTCNARPYSHHDWHWRLLVAHRFGHAASAPTVHGTLGCSTKPASRAR